MSPSTTIYTTPTQQLNKSTSSKSTTPSLRLLPADLWLFNGDRRSSSRSHSTSETRFTLIGNDDDPHGVMAFTAYSFQQPRTRRTKRAVAMLRLTPGRRGELVGEAHFPVGLDRAWLRDLSRRIHGSAYWDKENLIRRFGYDVLRL